MYLDQKKFHEDFSSDAWRRTLMLILYVILLLLFSMESRYPWWLLIITVVFFILSAVRPLEKATDKKTAEFVLGMAVILSFGSSFIIGLSWRSVLEPFPIWLMLVYILALARKKRALLKNDKEEQV